MNFLGFGVEAPAGGVASLDAMKEGEESPVAPVSSRAIDFASGQYVHDTEGNFAGMSDLHQRVALLIAYRVRVPDIVGPSFKSSIAAEVRRALLPLTGSRPQAVVIKAIEAEPSAGGTHISITFADGQRLRVTANGASRT